MVFIFNSILKGAKTAAVNRKKRMSNSKYTLDRKRWQLSVGKGSHIGARTLISIPLDASTVDADFRFVGFSTGFGYPGFFRKVYTHNIPCARTLSFVLSFYATLYCIATLFIIKCTFTLYRVWGTGGETTRTLNIAKPNGAVTTQRAEIKIKGSFIAFINAAGCN